jgi:hypothetical protein
MWSAIASFILGGAGWLVVSFFGKPFLDTLNLRSQVHEEVVFAGNIDEMVVGTPVYHHAVESLRRLGAKMQTTNVTAMRPLSWLLSWQGYDLVTAGSNLIGLSNSLAIPDRAFHIDKIQAALKLPREYEADYLHDLRKQKLQRQ